MPWNHVESRSNLSVSNKVMDQKVHPESNVLLLLILNEFYIYSIVLYYILLHSTLLTINIALPL